LLIGFAVAFPGARLAHIVDESCLQPCDDDDADGHCPPDCGDCTCCAHPAPIIPAATRLSVLSVTLQSRYREPAESLPPSADPGEVFHIPKSARV
jgi:hypothetical protein